MDLQLRLFNLLSLVVYLFMMMNKAHLLIVSPLIITSGFVLVESKTEESSCYYLSRIILQCHFNYPKTILGNSIKLNLSIHFKIKFLKQSEVSVVNWQYNVEKSSQIKSDFVID
jgi:hypothetical protein